MTAVNVSTAADLLDLDRSTVARWIKRGEVEPVGKDGRTPVYRLPDLLKVIPLATLGLVDDCDLNLMEENAKLRQVQRHRIELELAERRRELIPADEVRTAWAGLVMHARARLLALPTWLAPQLATADTWAAREQTVKAAIYDALTELAQGGDDGLGAIEAELETVSGAE